MATSKPTQKSALNIVMGAMTFGEEGQEGARVYDVKEIEAILDIFQAHGHDEIDTARTYCGGTCEEYIGRVDWKKRGLKMETKLAPRLAPRVTEAVPRITHSPEDLRKNLEISLQALQTEYGITFLLTRF